MSRRAKNLVLISSFAAFFILSCLVVLYAFGYQFDFKNFKLVETGGLLVKANTDGIKVSINGRLQGKTSFLSSTFVKKNLLPGDYTLKIEKENFSTLNKKIKIKSGEVNQLIHLYLANAAIISDYTENLSPVEENKDYFINKIDGLLYKNNKNEKPEKVSSEPVYIKDFTIKPIENNIYIASKDIDAPGVFLLDRDGNWEQIYDTPVNNLTLSPDSNKLAIVSLNEVTVLWLKDDNDPPYLKKGHKELILKISEKIKDVFWFKTSWHLVYSTENGGTGFIELDSTGGRNDVKI